MAISTLSTLAARYFKGGSWIYSSNSSYGLRAVLNTMIAKINEIIAGMVDLDTLTVGNAATYYLGGDSWMVIDGVNPPIFSRIWLQDTATGTFYVLSVTSGALGIAPA
jgi:hypothetical protein